jgi:hypothetical protein
MHRTGLVIMLALVAGAATAQVADSRIRIANEGTIGDKWKLADGITLAMPVYPAQLAERKADVCVALGYVIAADGTTENFTVLQQWSSEGEKEPVEGYWKSFAEAGADALAAWKFQPKPDAGTVIPTHTVATLVFNGGAGIAPADLRGHCKIADLASHLEKVKDKRWQRGDMNRRFAEQDRRRMEQREVAEAIRRVQRKVE